MRRDTAIRSGGFDEVFEGGSYREEADFALKMESLTGVMTYFEPKASLVHLGERTGGVRAHGEGTQVGKITSVRDSRGDYLFGFRWLKGRRFLRHLLMRPLSVVASRYCLKRPWLIIALAFREAVAMAAAFMLWSNSVERRPLSDMRDSNAAEAPHTPVEKENA